ncbi:MAG TPA: iron-containing alcohol dehydrogenase [Solirubrobacter sp.]
MTLAPPPSAPDVARDLAALRVRLASCDEAATLRPLGLGGLLLGAGVLDRIAEVVADVRRGGGDVALIADARPMDSTRGEVKTRVTAALAAAGLPVRRVRVGDDDADVHADTLTLRRAVKACAGAGVVLSVGSGTVADIGKAVSAQLGRVPHVVVQTAASVNGFADDQSVLLVNGVKHTTPTRWPERLVIDSDVITRAPVELNRAGFGDLLATYTAPADWRLAQLVGQDDSYSPFAVGLARAHVDAVLEHADGIHRAEPEAIEHLGAALTLSGIAMGVAGRTAPGSGMEHTVSHLLEMAERPGVPAPLHGAKVGALSVLAAMLWARVRTVARCGGLRMLRFPSERELEPQVRQAFAELDPSGRVGDACWADYRLKLGRWHDARGELETLWERWPAFDAELERLLVSPERLVEALRAARAPVRLTQLGVRDSTARWALAHGHLMRDRFSVADLAFFMGIWDSAGVDALLVAAARLGAGL